MLTFPTKDMIVAELLAFQGDIGFTWATHLWVSTEFCSTTRQDFIPLEARPPKFGVDVTAFSFDNVVQRQSKVTKVISDLC